MTLPKRKTFHLISERVRNNCVSYLLDIPVGEDYEVQIRKTVKDKTLKQLGALFGLWTKEEADRTGESEDHVYRKWKAKFLARIYCIEPMTPEQESWVELLAHYQQIGDQVKLERHAKRISLSWATLKQVSEFMKAIEQHYMAEGRPLTIPDPEWKKRYDPDMQDAA